MATVVILSLVISVEATPSTDAGVEPAADQAAVLHAVALAPFVKAVPVNLQPSLATTQQDFAGHNTHPGFACGWLPSAPASSPRSAHSVTHAATNSWSSTENSHAYMWLPAFDKIAIDAHYDWWPLNSSYFCPA